MKKGFNQVTNVGYAINCLVQEIMKQEIMIMYQENIEALQIEVVIVILN